MSGGFPDPQIRVHAEFGRYSIQSQWPDGWATICTRERRDAADACRDGIVRVLAAHTDLIHKAAEADASDPGSQEAES